MRQALLSAAVLLSLCAAALVRAAEPSREGPPPGIVIIDPGHGGEDRGAVVKGRVEKDIVLDVAWRLFRRFEKSEKTTPYLTRWDDFFVPLSDRPLRAQRLKADAFVSIHVDRNYVRKGRGTIIYVYGKNPSIPDGPPRSPGEVHLPPPPRSQRAASRRLAASISRSFKKHGIHTVNYVDLGAFAVLKARDVPSVLIEVANLRDAEEAALLDKPEWRDEFARAVEEGVQSFLKSQERRKKRKKPSKAKARR